MALTFQSMGANAKLVKLLAKTGIRKNEAYSFSLPAGHACPFAYACLSKANRETGKLTDGKHAEYRCFSASQEAFFPQTRTSRWNNFTVLRTAGNDATALASVIHESLPTNAKLVRIHVSGDFYSQAYFDAWLIVAESMTNTVFYAYTKSLGYWVTRLDRIPTNLRLTASYGGSNDALIEAHNLRSARVVFSVDEANALGLDIDHDDSHAMDNGPSFALLLHGGQPKGSLASKALSAIRAAGQRGYADTKKLAQSRKRYASGKYGHKPTSIKSWALSSQRRIATV
jgi:hypothetical protein